MNSKVGIDIGSFAVKLVHLEENTKGLTLVHAGIKELPIKSGQNSSETQKAAVIQALKDFGQEYRMKTKKVRLVISDPALYLRQISIPRVTEEELVKAVKWQAEKYIPFSVDEAIVDYQPLDVNSEIQELMSIVIVAAKNETINQYLTILQEAKLSTNLIDVSCFAMAKAYEQSLSAGEEHLVPLIDIGAKTTTLLVLKGNALKFVRNINCAGDHFSKAIAEGLKIDKTDAEKKKKEISLTSNGQEKGDDSKIFLMLEPLLSELSDQINRSFAYCEKEGLIEDMKKVLLCGGGAKMEGLDQFLTKKLGITFELMNPFKNINIDEKRVNAASLTADAPRLTAALGAAL